MRGVNRLRRYPALAFLVVAAVLATLLPSALLIPLSGPSASAELAPVPGKSDGAGDLTALGATSTGGLGSGAGLGDGAGGGEAEDDGPPDPPPGDGRNLRNKRCVGSPARQTEDPWSPTCVGFFDGDNFGATGNGVTADEIRIVILGNCRSGGTFDVVDLADPANANDRRAGYVRYFNERFQTYKRKVHLFEANAADSTTPCSDYDREAIQRVKEVLDPFLIFPTIGNRILDTMAAEAARLGMMTIMEGPFRSTTELHAPYVISYIPDLDDLVANMVEALCARLAGDPARLAGDPSMHATKRKFGLWYNRTGQDPTNRGAKLFTDGVARRCGTAAGDIKAYYLGNTGRQQTDAASAMRLEGVTTVVGFDTDLTAYSAADAAKWYPEWFVNNEFLLGHNERTRINGPPTVMRSLFGLMERRRLGPPATQHHRMALAEGCPDCISAAHEDLYNTFLLIYTGIQAAGPRLNAANVDRGLHSLPARQSRDPYAPSAYFAPNNHSFLKDFAVVWWDPAGQPPADSRRGCWRLVEDGLRYRAEDWAGRPGDAGLQQASPEQPCQGEVT
jgi:hypothetical protein